MPNYLVIELRYRDSGERPARTSRAKRGFRVTNSHDIHHDFGDRHASAALG